MTSGPPPFTASVSLEKRDGAARIASMDGYKLPLMIDFLKRWEFEFVESIDFGFAPYSLKYLDKRRYEILGSKDENITVASGLKTLSPRKKVDALFSLRKKDWRALYAPAAASPQNVPLLVYLGADIVDNILPIVEAYNGNYMLGETQFNVNTLKELPCTCSVCSSTTADELKNSQLGDRSELLALHNTKMLENQLVLIREHIRSDNLRNFVEWRSKTDPELAAILRIADEEDSANSPFFKRSRVLFTSLEFDRPELSLFLERATNSYNPQGKTVVILPCTATKPYLNSKTHRTLRKEVNFRGVNEIIISSPLVSPRELELCYPVINYDTTVTGHWTGDEIRFVAQKLAHFISRGNFERIIAHVDGTYQRIVEEATDGMEVTYTCVDGVLNHSSIERLKEEVKDSPQIRFSLYHSMFDHMCRYQFGVELDGIDRKYKVKGRYPHLELYSGKERVMRMDTRYGMLDIDIPFAEYLLEVGVKKVRIDNFDPKGTVFAAGILEADSSITPNDVVVFYNDNLLGVGISHMFGKEMVEMNSGHAIRVRRKSKLRK
ncbi:MAG: archaeosine synthase subunit alpha [Archaeoglobaceae archaeon]